MASFLLMLNSTLENKLCAALLNLYSIDQAGPIILLLVMISVKDAGKSVEFLRSDPPTTYMF